MNQHQKKDLRRILDGRVGEQRRKIGLTDHFICQFTIRVIGISRRSIVRDMGRMEPTEKAIAEHILRSLHMTREEFMATVLPPDLLGGIEVRRGSGKIRSWVKEIPYIFIVKEWDLVTVYLEEGGVP